ncbi:MAG TPA: alpha/beta hydrolase [Afifellaceae bacterium]|nr:alpha/beta hydrolase [Afifellaceae bacterium]
MPDAGDNPVLDTFIVGAGGPGDEGREIAVRRRAGRGPGLVWLGGFKSDMEGGKAVALDRWAGENGHACTRFDYSGLGSSGGAFEGGTISMWLEESLAVIRRFTEGPQILVGSSMGGWIALLAARALREAGEGDLLAGMVLIAPAVNMTEELMWKRFDGAARAELAATGAFRRPSAYSDEPYVITKALIEDGRMHLIGDGPLETGCPVHVLQGMKDEDVPWSHATALMERFAHDDAVLTLVADGDHRLSRPEDIERLTRTVEGLIGRHAGGGGR